MQSSQGRQRRQLGAEEDLGGGNAVSRVDYSYPDYPPHSQLDSHSQERYRGSPSRNTFEMRPESSSSYSRREEDGWRHGDDRYGWSPRDKYQTGARDDYDYRESGSWNAGGDDQRGSGRQWREGYDQGYSIPQQESSSWGTKSNQHEQRDRDPGYSKWSVNAEPSGQRRNNRNGNHSNDKQGDKWRKDEGRDANPQEWRSDNGWESRRRSIPHNSAGSYNDEPLDEPPGGVERSWEPAASWQANNQSGSQGQRRHQHNRNKGGKNKKSNQNRQQKRDWRTNSDDSHLNNWTKRDPLASPEKYDNHTAERGQRMRSISRSRSRSPAESYYSRRSRRSSIGRSPSPESASRRRRRPNRAGPPRSRSPADRRQVRDNRRNHRYSRSPSPLSPRTPFTPERRGRGRQRSPYYSPNSSLSRTPSRSRSGSRSVSMSPRDRSKAIHRLPVSTSLKDIQITVKKPKGGQNKGKNGRAEANGKRKAHSNRQYEAAGAVSNDMPPPALPPSNNRSLPLRPPSPIITDPSLPNNEARSAIKIGGFKPIGQQNSSLKRFFPGDDDEEEEHATQHQATTTSPVVKQRFIPTSDNGWETKRARQADNHEKTQRNQSPEGSHEFRMPEDPMASTSSFVPSIPSRSPPPHLSSASRHTSQFLGSQSVPAPRIPTKRGSEYDPMSVSPITRHPSPGDSSKEELYSIVSQVGEGTFGKVYKARNTRTGLCVALKRIRMEAERDGFPVTAMREIKLLQSLRQDNIVQLYEMMVSNGSVYMVFEYMDHDLTGILSQSQFTFTDAHLKSFCHQMLSGLAYLHHRGVIHRDIKGSNILVNHRGALKLGDFGLARFYQKRRRSDYTNRVITLWYRPPELLFGETVYGPEVDMWSAGCIMLELFTKRPVFQGNDEIHQLDVIYRIIGTPTSERWPGLTNLPWYELVKPKEVIPNHFRELFQKWLSSAGLDLADQLLCYDPAHRVSATSALNAPYFKTEQPRMERPSLQSLQGEWHELETKRERAKKKRKLDDSGPAQT